MFNLSVPLERNKSLDRDKGLKKGVSLTKSKDIITILGIIRPILLRTRGTRWIFRAK
jgi:hypothetical protein